MLGNDVDFHFLAKQNNELKNWKNKDFTFMQQNNKFSKKIKK